MAFWNKISTRGNVQDRRGSSGAVGGGLSLTGIALVVLFTYLNGGDLGDVFGQLQGINPSAVQQYSAEDFQGEDSYEIFASKVLGSADAMWKEEFAKRSVTYAPPTLVLFRDATQSACGGAQSRSGPHYCPNDSTIYLDETFFEELTSRFGAEGGDVAEAYVIAHEVGHHVQSQLGLLNEGRYPSPEESIRTELQADCFAGLWAYSLRSIGVFEAGEIHEAMDAAAAVGDDRIQSKATGRITPETWTHGSSAQRMAAFDKGYETGSFEQCTR